ncbi:uncharacterized protein LOC122992020 [Thunnus albacares]|uniref:uncharacterized protein LOC122992020 n=1 Tax=Thunnus albacares TaxID=8236 RepID=UPI001CF6AB32|nr:uncharacterized protein LOC122992020 [Thunnus albacares]XP_044221478.1 uncharacterized protein LOC122992020 [Thunnus albacares]
MTHFRGQIRGPHWGPTMDNMLIDFWRKHECLFNSSLESYYDKHLKTKLWTEFAVSIGKPVSDVERRSRSLRTQYGRVLWHPERVNTFQQRMLREKLDFLRPYIVRRRGDSFLEDKFDDREEDDDELETEGSVDQEMGSTFGSPLDADVTGRDPDDELQFVASPSNSAPLHCPNSQPQVTEVMSLSCDRHNDEGSPDQPDHTAAPNTTSKYDILSQFAEVMLADMRQIKDPMVLMRLRRDITDLVFKAVEEDVQRRCVRAPSMPSLGEGEQVQSSSRPQQLCSQTNFSWRQRFLRRKNKGSEIGRRMQRWEEMKHMRRTSRSQLLQPVQQSQALEGMSENISQAMIQASEIKTETEPHMVKIEEETTPVV